MISRVLFLAVLLLIPGDLRAKSLPKNADFAPNLTIYLAKGPPNACGPGCDHWIAIEGNVDRNAAPRIRGFLMKVKDTQLPVYLHSPGGVVEQSFVIGRLLRSRKAVARVGRTIVTACSAGTQVDDACLKIKTGGGEVEAEIVTRRAMCNSACGYLFLGATTREVPPDAAMAVHNSKLTVVFHGHPSAQQIAAFNDRSIVQARRERESFVKAMDINRELNDLIEKTPFVTSHVLTRSELYQFGIDTRTMAETAWTFESAARPYARKIILMKKTDGASFRSMEWRLFCENKDRARLMFIREFDVGAAGVTSAILMAGTEKLVSLGAFPAQFGIYEARSETIAPDSIKTFLAASHLQMGASTLMSDGKANQETFDIDGRGLESAWAQLLVSCPAPNRVRPSIAFPAPAFAPVQ
jgi:hypothetical protein